MNKWYIEFYYAREYGVIIVDDIPLMGKPFPTPVNPAIYPMHEISSEILGKIAIDRMAKAAQALPVDKEDPENYWQISGIKSFKKFSQISSNILAFSDDSGVHISQMKTHPKTGGYTLDQSKPTINLPSDVAPAVLGEMLLSVLQKLAPDEEPSDSETIETILGKQVNFKIPGSDFEDHRDGHTDSYKVYRHSKSNETMLAFMIDSGYKGYDEESIREKWEQWFGNLDSFNCERIDGKTIVSASTGKIELASYLYRIEEEMLELLTIIDKTALTTCAIERVRKDFETVVQSVSF